MAVDYLAAPRPTLGHYQGERLIHLMLITAFGQVSTQGSPSAKRLVGFKLGTFQFIRDALGHSPRVFEVLQNGFLKNIQNVFSAAEILREKSGANCLDNSNLQR